MSWHRVDLHQCAPQAWRNGGGITHELAAWPTPDDWQWRVSVARIDRDGPFSAFEDVQRWFAVLTGNGVRLSWPTHQTTLTPQSQPLSFAGAPACHAQLVDGVTLDFNLMTRSLRGELIRQSATPTQGTWPAHAHVGVFACTDCLWQLEGTAIEQAPHSLHWGRLAAASAWSWCHGDALVFVLQKEQTP